MVHDTACAGTADKTILAPTIHIPSSHPGHQTKKHPARKAGNISSRLFSRKTRTGNPQICGFRKWEEGCSPRRTRGSRRTEAENVAGTLRRAVAAARCGLLCKKCVQLTTRFLRMLFLMSDRLALRRTARRSVPATVGVPCSRRVSMLGRR